MKAEQRKELETNALADRMGQPKVQEHDLPFAADEHVGGLEVPVRDSPPVQKVQDGADLTERSKKPRRGGAAQGGKKIASIHALGGGERSPQLSVETTLVERDDPGVAQAVEQPALLGV